MRSSIGCQPPAAQSVSPEHCSCAPHKMRVIAMPALSANQTPFRQITSARLTRIARTHQAPRGAIRLPRPVASIRARPAGLRKHID